MPTIRDDRTREQVIQEIIDECNQHNANISDDEPRDPAYVKMDAGFIYMHREEGITVETLCMMLTDTTFALRKERGQIDPPPAP